MHYFDIEAFALCIAGSEHCSSKGPFQATSRQIGAHSARSFHFRWSTRIACDGGVPVQRAERPNAHHNSILRLDFNAVNMR
jgi:hypothetical protein